MSEETIKPVETRIRAITPDLIARTARILAELQKRPQRDVDAEERAVQLVESEHPMSKDGFIPIKKVGYGVHVEATDMNTSISYVSNDLIHSGPREKDVNFIRFHRVEKDDSWGREEGWHMEVVDSEIGWAWHIRVEDVVNVTHKVKKLPTRYPQLAARR